MTYVPPNRALVTLRDTDRLERSLKKRDLSGAELAMLAKRSRQIVSNLRTGRTRRTDVETARRISSALGVPTEYLWAGLDEIDEATA